MESRFTISLNDLLFRGRHGVFPEEKKMGNDFVVNLSVSYSAPEGDVIKEDDLSNSVCYASLYDIVKEEMEIPRDLLETVAFSIGKRILERYSVVDSLECEITKKHPPIPNFIGTAAVKYKVNK